MEGSFGLQQPLQQSLFALNALLWPASDTVKLKEVYAMFAQNAQRHAGRPRMGAVWRDQTEYCRLFTRIKRRQLLAIIFLSDSNALLLLLLFQVITLRGNVDFIFHLTLCISHSLFISSSFSVLGHRIPEVPVPLFSVYPATKHAITALCQTVRQEIHFLKLNIKLTVS